MFYVVGTHGENNGGFYIYDLSTDRRVITSNIAANSWASNTDFLASGGTSRSQSIWMRRYQRAGFISELSTTDPFEYTDSKSEVAWSSSSVGLGTIYPLMYNPDANRISGMLWASGYIRVRYSDNGGANWTDPGDVVASGHSVISYGAWGRDRAKYVAASLNCNVAEGNYSYSSSDGISYTATANAFDGGSVKAIGINNVTYSPTINSGTYCAVAATGNGGRAKKAYLSTAGTTFTGYTISADDVSWASVIWVPFLSKFVAVAGWGPSGSTASQLVATSTDGQTWAVASSMPASRNWYRLACNATHIACIVYNSNIVATSTDAASWTEHTLPWTVADGHIGAFYSTAV